MSFCPPVIVTAVTLIAMSGQRVSVVRLWSAYSYTPSAAAPYGRTLSKNRHYPAPKLPIPLLSNVLSTICNWIVALSVGVQPGVGPCKPDLHKDFWGHLGRIPSDGLLHNLVFQ